jgi:hypothetical protein
MPVDTLPAPPPDPSFVRTLRHCSAALGGLAEALALVVPDPCAAFRAGKLSAEDHETAHDMTESSTGLSFLAKVIEASGSEENGTLPVTAEFVQTVCACAADSYERASALIEKLSQAPS